MMLRCPKIARLRVLLCLALLPWLAGCEPPKGLLIQVQETAAFANISRIGTAQNVYLNEHEGLAAKSIADLGELLDPPALRAATSKETAFQGYYFRIMPGQKPYEFSVIATPANHGVTGVQTFLLLSDGAVYSRDLQGAELSEVPAKPEASGWTKRRAAARVIGPEEESLPPSKP